MMEWSCVPLDKCALRVRGISIIIALFGIPSIWGSQNDMLQQRYFRSNISFSDPRETSVVKKNLYPNTEEKFKYLQF